MQSVLLPTKRSIYQSVDSKSGILMAAVIIFFWLSSFIVLLRVDISQIPWFLIILIVFVRAFLHTGLFITAHDAIHGTVFPQNRTVNDFIGGVAAQMYVLLPFKILLEKHQLHHNYPASEKDPDFWRNGKENPILWYINFMREYLKGNQSWIVLIGMSVIFYSLWLGIHIPLINLVLFWLFPLFISSIQLFYFGIFLPHRQPKDGYNNRHRAISINFSVFWSFLSCYHFGYHWEHHEYPQLPWYKLPSVIKSAKC